MRAYSAGAQKRTAGAIACVSLRGLRMLLGIIDASYLAVTENGVAGMVAQLETRGDPSHEDCLALSGLLAMADREISRLEASARTHAREWIGLLLLRSCLGMPFAVPRPLDARIYFVGEQSRRYRAR